ncbi:MAG: ferredoxin [Bacteroidales bacterium]|jgi:ferredoxin|nr:ferredoxin [Bacteroidales bacterium]
MNYNISTIFFSPSGTTAKVVKTIAASLGKIHKEYDLTLLKSRLEYKALTFSSKDLVIVGVPVYKGRIPDFLADYFQYFKGTNAKAVYTVVYGNRAYEDALLELKNIFETAGFIGVAAGAFIGEHSYSGRIASRRPDSNDLKIARDFGQKINAKLDHLDVLSKSTLFVKGNFPYKALPPAPQIVPRTNDNCTDCSICADLCPMEAIDFNNFRDTDPTKCILCCSCVKNCPEDAKIIVNENIVNFTKNLISKLESIRHEPELFLDNKD